MEYSVCVAARTAISDRLLIGRVNSNSIVQVKCLTMGYDDSRHTLPYNGRTSTRANCMHLEAVGDLLCHISHIHMYAGAGL